MNLVVVGPRSVGKSTTSALLAKELNYTYLEGDALVHDVLEDLGGLDGAIKAGLTKEVMQRGFNVVKETLAKDKIVFDLAGGAISARKGEELGINQEVRKLIQEKATVIGLLPYEDDEKSIQLLFDREQQRKHFRDEDPKELLEKV